MKKFNLKIIIVVITLLSFVTAKSQNTSWYSTPSKTTSKIRVTTNLKDKDLARAGLNRIMHMHMLVDTNQLNPMRTLPKQVGNNNLFVKFNLQMVDSCVIISGQWSNGSLKNWKDITNKENGIESRAYEVMTIIADGWRGAKIEYNK